MTENILVAIAWPYANSSIHVGNITGSHLPGDIFARFHRLLGNRVVMVSGSDAHGTPVSVRADAEGTSPLQIYQHFHAGFLELFQKLGISYDLFTSTHTENHFTVAQDIFLSLKKNGYLYTESQKQWYAPLQGRFLPDRYVEGTCYLCGYEGARGDQCDNCGNLLDANLLLNPRSKTDGSVPELRETEHFYLDLGALEPDIVDFLRQKEGFWRPNVLRQSLGQILANGLHGRAITRDLDWGIPVPEEGWQGKCLYVWFEAVIGYLSAAIEWAQVSAQPEAWEDWWLDTKARAYYFIGKDNIPFHAVIWPAQLIGSGEWFGKLFMDQDGTQLNLPYDIPANEFLNMEGKKFSGSRNWAVWGLDFLNRYDPDPLRYYLTANMPESKDTDWDWDDFVRRNNDELVATWGNLANRMLSFAYKNWESRVPTPGKLRPPDQEILAAVEAGFDQVAEHLKTVHLRAGLNEALRLATEANKYIDKAAPWFEIKSDRDAAATSVYTALRVIDSLKTLFAPFLPFSSERLNTYLGYDQPLFGEQYISNVKDSLGEHQVLRYKAGSTEKLWVPSQLPAGQPLVKPQPLFRKLDTEIADKERSLMG